MNIYQDNSEYLQKIIHVSREKLIDKYGKEACQGSQLREYTTLVFYNKRSKMVRFEVAITHPKLDRFSREAGRNEVLKKLANDKPFMLVDISEVVKDMDPVWERKIVSHLLSDFTHEIIPRKLFGKK